MKRRGKMVDEDLLQSSALFQAAVAAALAVIFAMFGATIACQVSVGVAAGSALAEARRLWIVHDSEPCEWEDKP